MFGEPQASLLPKYGVKRFGRIWTELKNTKRNWKVGYSYNQLITNIVWQLKRQILGNDYSSVWVNENTSLASRIALWQYIWKQDAQKPRFTGGVSYGSLGVKQQKPTLANLNQKEIYWKNSWFLNGWETRLRNWDRMDKKRKNSMGRKQHRIKDLRHSNPHQGHLGTPLWIINELQLVSGFWWHCPNFRFQGRQIRLASQGLSFCPWTRDRQDTLTNSFPYVGEVIPRGKSMHSQPKPKAAIMCYLEGEVCHC